MWSHIQNLKIQTRPEEWFVQPVLCIVVTGSCPDLPLKTLYRGDQCQILELSLVEPPDSFVSCWLQVIAGRPLQKKLQIFFWVTSKDTDLIFVTNIINNISGEIAMWRNFSFPCMAIVRKLKIFPNVKKFQMSPHDRCGEIWHSPHMACVWCRKLRHIYAKFIAIYAVLLLNLLFTPFCQAISCGEKLSPKVHL